MTTDVERARIMATLAGLNDDLLFLRTRHVVRQSLPPGAGRDWWRWRDCCHREWARRGDEGGYQAVLDAVLGDGVRTCRVSASPPRRTA
jgi:hypothetical protein